jgi:hypothetical protein
MDKGITLDVARNVLRNCINSGMAVHIFSMIGFPQEKERSARKTLQFFLEHASLLRHPRHSFDIHRFGLDLRTDYFDNAASYGALIDYEALQEHDFPLSVMKWTNRDGLSDADVDRLLEEFESDLYDEFIGTRLYPDQHWPGFEEYAVLYGDHYEDSHFQHRTALPAERDSQPFHLEWAHSARFGNSAEDVRTAWGVAGEATLARAAFAALTPLPGDMTVNELLGTLSQRIEHLPEQRPDLESELREVVDKLLAERLLWFRAPKSTNGHSHEANKSIPNAKVRPVDRPLRLCRDVEIRVTYEDNTLFGSPVGLKPIESCRHVFSHLLKDAQTHGIHSTILNGPKLIHDVMTSSEFRNLMDGSNRLRSGVLYPDPSLAKLAGISLIRGTGEEMFLEVKPDDWCTWARLIAGSSNGMFLPGVSDSQLVEELLRRGMLEPANANSTSLSLDSSEVTFIGHNSVLLRSEGTSVVVDPFFVPAIDLNASYRPLGREQLGQVDAVVVTHLIRIISILVPCFSLNSNTGNRSSCRARIAVVGRDGPAVSRAGI